VHLTLGILRTSQAFFHALAFFWLDGFAVPAPAQVTQAVGRSVNVEAHEITGDIDDVSGSLPKVMPKTANGVAEHNDEV
jgi:hypothetical protein